MIAGIPETELEGLINETLDKCICDYRHLHQHPELSFEEHQTSAYILHRLNELGYSEAERIAETGITALLKPLRSAPCIAIRADHDALPIQEQTGLSYASDRPGVMHACGHDAHTAVVLNIAGILQKIKDRLPGNVKFIFQPGEEKLPGGASMLIHAGVLNNPDVLCILGQHTTPEIESGRVGIKPGPFMASTDELYIAFTGKGGHAAKPAETINPILCASEFLVQYQRTFHAWKEHQPLPILTAFGKIIADGATNVIPDSCRLEGTLRTFDKTMRQQAHELIRRVAREAASAFHAEVETRIVIGYPVLTNSEELTNRIKKSLERAYGSENVNDLPVRMTAEDFAFYSEKTEACFYRWGTGNAAKGITAGNHSSRFRVDEDAFYFGIKGMLFCILSELEHRFIAS